MAKPINYVQLDTFAAENFDHYVASQSTKQVTTTHPDRYSGFIVEIVTHYRGSRILGYQERNRCGYRYYLRKD